MVGRLKFLVQPLTLLDLAAVIPFYLPHLLPIDGRALRTLRLLKIFHLTKAGIYSRSVQRMGTVLRAKSADLMATSLAMVILLVVSSTLMHHVEHGVEAHQEAANFTSIPNTMWWTITTMVPLSYGDVVPKTTAGKILGGCTAVLGITLFVLPAGILASGFSDQSRREVETCPHCGEPL